MRPIVFATLLLLAGSAAAADLPHHHLAGFLGGGAETTRGGREREIGIAAGIQYEYRFHQQWGVGGLFELLGQDTLRNAIVAVPVSWHPSNNWRLFVGPGYEFTDKKDKALLRVGVGYEIHVNDRWTVAPEIFADFIDDGARTLVGGVAFGYQF